MTAFLGGGAPQVGRRRVATRFWCRFDHQTLMSGGLVPRPKVGGSSSMPTPSWRRS